MIGPVHRCASGVRSRSWCVYKTPSAELLRATSQSFASNDQVLCLAPQHVTHSCEHIHTCTICTKCKICQTTHSNLHTMSWSLCGLMCHNRTCCACCRRAASNALLYLRVSYWTTPLSVVSRRGTAHGVCSQALQCWPRPTGLHPPPCRWICPCHTPVWQAPISSLLPFCLPHPLQRHDMTEAHWPDGSE